MDTRFLAVIGVGLVVAAVVAALVLRGGAAAPVATTPTSSPSSVAPSVGPPSTPDADDLAINRFWVLIADPKLSYHVDTKGGGRIGSDAYTFSESLDVTGDSWAGTERAHGLGGGGVLSIVTIDTNVWFKFPDGWHKNIEHDPYFRSRPFLDLGTQRDLVVSGTVEKGGKTLYDLKSTTNYQPYPGRLIGFFSMGIAGRPARARHLRDRGRRSGPGHRPHPRRRPGCRRQAPGRREVHADLHEVRRDVHDQASQNLR